MLKSLHKDIHYDRNGQENPDKCVKAPATHNTAGIPGASGEKDAQRLVVA